MLRRFALIALAGLAAAAPAAAQDAATVGGRPALTTKSAQDLIAQRDKWGTAPSATKAAKGEPPPPAAKAAKAVAATAAAAAGAYAVLPTDDIKKLFAEREKWGKGPAGYEKKKVVAPPAAKATAAPAKAAPAKKPAKAAKAAPKKKKKN